MIYKILACIFIVSSFSCIFGDKPLVRKRTEVGEITVEWYYYSRITHNSPDIVTISKGKETVDLYEAKDIVTDVIVAGNRVIIRLFNPRKERVFIENVPSSVFNFQIILDSSATSEELAKVPHPIK